MINADSIIALTKERIEESNIFLVDVLVGHSNDVRVLVDSMEGVSIEECVELSRWLNGKLEAIEDNFSLEVSSPGIGAPFKVIQQYEKNISRELEVVFKDGKKKKGILTAISENGITLDVIEKQIAGGSQKKKKEIKVSKEFAFEDIKSSKEVIKF